MPTKWRTEMRVRWNEYADLIMEKCGFNNGNIRARWIGPLRLAVCFVGNFVVDMAHLWSIHNIFEIRLKHIHGMFATCSFCVCYIPAKQKYGFWRVKVWFLACKKWIFALQKYGFCFSNVMLLQIGRNAFRGRMWISHRMFAILFQFVSSVMAGYKQP